MHRFRFVLLLGFLALTGCPDNPDVDVPVAPPVSGGAGGTPVGVVVDSIDVTPATSNIPINGTQLFTGTALEADGTPITGVSFGWTSSDTSVATIGSSGLATAVSPGTTQITATAGGVTSAPVDLVVDCAGIPAAVVNATIVPATVSTFGTSSITADVTDCNGNPVPDGTQVQFSLTPAGLGSVTTPSNTVTQGTPSVARATSTFSAANVSGSGTITITSANATPAIVGVTVVPPSAGSIEFVSASPTIIGVKGASQPETSVIKFSVKDQNGNPVADGTQIDFEMIGPNCVSQLPEPFRDDNNNDVFDAGEIFDDRDLSGDYTNVTVDCPNPSDDLNDEFITPVQGSTVNGEVSVTLHSGKVAGPVKIIATVHGQVLSTGTTGVSIGGGIPSASGFHISATQINIAGHVVFGGYDDQTSTLTAYIKDRFGNSNVLTGTSISFMTEAGTLVSSNVTAGTSGTVSTDLTSQGTVPVNVRQRIDLTITSGNGQNELEWVDPVQIAFANYPSPLGIGGTALVYDLYWTTAFDRFPNDLLGGTFNAAGTGWSKLSAIGASPFTHSGLTNDTPYFYVLVASDGNGRVAQSTLLSGTPRATASITDYDVISEPSYPDIYPTAGNSITTAIRNPRDGWVTITGIVQGEETFFDANGNGFYDIGEQFIDTPGEPFIDADDNGLYTTPEEFVDINLNGIYDFGEPFIDGNDNGLYDEGDPVFLDANDNGQWDGPNGQWDSNTFIWNTITLAFTGVPYVDSSDRVADGTSAPFNSAPQTGSRIEIDFLHQDLSGGAQFSDNFIIPNGDCATMRVYISDANLNPLVPGSSVSVEAEEYDVFGPLDFVLPDGLPTGPYVFQNSLCDDDAANVEPRPDTFTVSVTWTVPDKDPFEVVMTVSGTVDFIGAPASISVAPSVVPTLPATNTIQLVGTVLDANGNPIPGTTLFWASDNTGVATVDSTGLVTAVASGTANITATTDGILFSPPVPVTVP